MIKENHIHIIELCKAYYSKPENTCGGNLHIVLDDGNMDVGCVEFCKNRCIEENDTDGFRIAQELLAIKYHERLKIYKALRQ
jgi:hypothetical protein